MDPAPPISHCNVVFCGHGKKTDSVLSCFIFGGNRDNTKSCKSVVKLAVMGKYMKLYPLETGIWHFLLE